MREESSLTTDQTGNSNRPHALPMTRDEPASSGFTALNGDGLRISSFRPDEALQNKSSLQDLHRTKVAESKSSDPPAQYHSHGLPTDKRTFSDQRLEPPPLLKTTASAKRKRDELDSDGDEDGPDQPYIVGSESPKRRVTTLDSAVDLPSPDKPNQQISTTANEARAREPILVGSYSRERSPVARWNAGVPPPKPRPETESALAASLKRTLDATQQAQSEEASPSPNSQALESYDQLEQSWSPEQMQHSYEADTKKRKRNFSNRTKTGCHTCRSRKKKCDERKPICANCERGGFTCGGYGPRPQNFKLPVASVPRAPPILQSKANYEPTPGPTGYYHNQIDEGPSYSHWGRIPSEQEPHPPTIDPRHHMSRPPWPHHHAPSPYALDRLPPTQIIEPPPHVVYPTAYHHQTPPHPPQPPPLPRPPPPLDHWSDHPGTGGYRPPTGGMMSSRDSATTTSSQRTGALAHGYGHGPHLSERDKMVLGKPFLHFMNPDLLSDRLQCKGALEKYNDAARTSTNFTSGERGSFFKAVVEPPCRPQYPRQPDGSYMGPLGSVGTNAIVESPFTCDYGYNLHIGMDVVIQAGCYMQDACEIHIGHRTIVGPNVKFYSITAPIDSSHRKGVRSLVLAGAIKVGEDVFVGGDSIILPFRTIGKGAVIGAGSVVTKDVKDYTVVAGNPARVIRRIESGPNVERHHHDIQEQNEKMLEEMEESARPNSDRRGEKEPC